MDKPQLQLEALKMVKEWSTWLVGIQVAICGFLWSFLNQNPMLVDPANNFPEYAHRRYDQTGFYIPGITLHAAWLFFALSLLVAAFLLLRMPAVAETLTEDDGESVLKRKTSGVRLETLVSTEYLFFLLGAALTAIFVIIK
jgi:hypothetical protein